MKLLRIAFLSSIFASQALMAQSTPSSAEERRAAAIGAEMESFTGADGRVFKDVRITRINDGGISIRHASGTARLRYGDLTPAQRAIYGMTRDEAIDTYLREEKRKENYEAAVEEKEAERAIKAAEQYRARLVAEAKAAAEDNAELTAQERRELSSPIPQNPTVSLSNAFLPSRSVNYRRYSGYRYSNFGFSNFRFFPTHRRTFSTRGFSPRSFHRGGRFSPRSSRASFIFR